MTVFRKLALAFVPILLSGCGSHVPSFVHSKQPHAEAITVNKIIGRVQCELRDAVRSAVEFDVRNSLEHNGERHIQWLDSWSAKLTLKMIADESSTVAPSISVGMPVRNSVTTFSNGPVTLGQSYGGALGFGVSSQAVRTQSADYFFIFKTDFLSAESERHPRDCIGGDGILIESDLKLREWLDAATFPFFQPGFVQQIPPQTLTYQAQFILTTSGNVNPVWRLVPVAVNTGGASLLSGNRKRTDDILITIGPTAAPNVAAASKVLEDSHFAAKISAGFFDAIRGQ